MMIVVKYGVAVLIMKWVPLRNMAAEKIMLQHYSIMLMKHHNVLFLVMLILSLMLNSSIVVLQVSFQRGIAMN